ncbi:SAM-dependent methyltransferase [Streptomyces jumonjinensis]|uniref:SAM-dependent methyltransferase n=1 Tax=Streptomyces jumonjinensis TaxID=1945 RepID=UPI0037964938
MTACWARSRHTSPIGTPPSTSTRPHRHFTQTATEIALRHGIRQFLDLGCGLPHHPDLHHLAPHGSPVVDVDWDPGVLAHATCRLAPGPRTPRAWCPQTSLTWRPCSRAMA